ncbi:hypothetical protein [Arthrobacter sp. PAMC25284]|uniref:hypothetical protein n=1 Tax=Arthrobacter sp. PAMC25284 TaxID=2861279 RepID=UPI001C62DEE4|nr:hypothetical protein [Arthrobacter sp. PAMC25284]QYF90007.1 hypothetical protein KY499_01005 [Arthrobacter sp. PAMC25284]
MSQEQPPIRSRRALREARDERLQAATDTGTARPDDARAVGAPASSPAPASNPAPASSPAQPAGQGKPAPAGTAGRNRRASDGPVDSSPTGPERSSQARARDRAALRTIKELAEKEGQLAGGGQPTRRQLRLLQLAAETSPATAANTIVPARPRTRATPVAGQPEATGTAAPAASPVRGGQVSAGMSVEQALAARELLVEQARNQVAKLEHIAAADPAAVDPAMLAEQIALAERAAVLNRRAAAKQKLADQTTQPAPVRNDPTTADNLAMVTPLEFIRVPGVDRPVMKPPATTHVPVATNPGPLVDAARKPGLRRGGTAKQRGTGSAAGRGGVLARAEAAAKAASAGASAGDGTASPETLTGAGPAPVAARSAHGLDPLDVATAGLGRARRLRILQAGVLALGLLALIAGIILIVTGLGR